MQAIEEISAAIGHACGNDFWPESFTAVTGGDISPAYRLTGASASYFVKLNAPQLLPMFEAEAEGLAAIHATQTVRVPETICAGANTECSWLVLEHIELHPRSDQHDTLLAEQLVALHQSSGERFGWHRDNTIGSTLQINTQHEQWESFFTRYRLNEQLALSAANGASALLLDRGAELSGRVPQFFTAYRPHPSLLHGDLWSGNRGCTAGGEPILFDPACYYGDRETDLAMTELFGGFSDRFYQSYVSNWAIDPGYKTRKVLYQLYHVLNHFNLFGGGYAAQALDMIDQLLAETS